jgi:urease accessory protein
MITLHTRLAHDHAASIDDTLVLTYDQRERCRLRATLASGAEAGIFVARGSVLRDGEMLTGPEGRVVRVIAAHEPTYAVRCDDAHTLLRCAYHLGNRHTQVQLGEGMLRMRVDPVLRDMVQGLGARVVEESAPFEPEAGAYSGGGHHHHGQRSDLLAPVPLRQKIHRPGDGGSGQDGAR